MPAPIAVSSNEYKWIRIYLQETYGITVVDSFDCQLLSEAIYKKNGIKISYSTFRRHFDLVPNNNSHSRFILNSISYSVGFRNWEHFKVHISSFDINVINQNIQFYASKYKNSDNIILETLKKLHLETWMGSYQFQSIISFALESKDFELLDEVVCLKFDLENQLVYEHLVFVFQTIYFQALNNNIEVIQFVSEKISSSVLLQKCLLQAYVNENKLDSFFGEWLDAIQENTINDLLLFKYLLLVQREYTIDSLSPNLKKYWVLIENEINKNIDIHPILMSRIGVWDLILNQKEEKLIDYFASLTNPFDQADFAVIACRLLWTFGYKNTSVLFLEKISLNSFPVVKDFFQKGRYNVLLITFAIHYYLKNNKVKSKEYLRLYNSTTLGYDIVNVEFYSKWSRKIQFEV